MVEKLILLRNLYHTKERTEKLCVKDTCKKGRNLEGICVHQKVREEKVRVKNWYHRYERKEKLCVRNLYAQKTRKYPHGE